MSLCNRASGIDSVESLWSGVMRGEWGKYVCTRLLKNQLEGIGTSGKQQTDRMSLASRHLVVDANQMTTLLLIYALTNRANTIVLALLVRAYINKYSVMWRNMHDFTCGSDASSV